MINSPVFFMVLDKVHILANISLGFDFWKIVDPQPTCYPWSSPNPTQAPPTSPVNCYQTADMALDNFLSTIVHSPLANFNFMSLI